MCTGMALARGDIPEALIARYGLLPRLAKRSEQAGDEFRFLWLESFPVLPVWHAGQFQIVPWGNRKRSTGLPLSGWCPREALDAGLWSIHRPEKVVIPATFALDRGVWYQVREGLAGICVVGHDATPRVYVLTEPASHYYEIMTRNTRAPVLVGEKI